ncbi:hypothetical protein [Methyloligella solikamskensis]|uniref:Uncharacterized protein n=1 Tax=Methyloligella solikamskensis TaxID=1177756 RepID=A0ABW3JAY0_9HYPH
MTSLMHKLTGITAATALFTASFAVLPMASTASAADVEIGRDGVEVDAGEDRHHHDRYDEHGEYHDHDRYDHSDHHDRDEDVNIRVPGANINID